MRVGRFVYVFRDRFVLGGLILGTIAAYLSQPVERTPDGPRLALVKSARAGEKYLGVIVSGAGADTTNDSTATPFYVPAGSKLTAYCTAAGFICTDQATACTTTGAGKGVPVAASTLFPTSVAKSSAVKVSSGTAANGGAYLRIVGAAAVTCEFWYREGNE